MKTAKRSKPVGPVREIRPVSLAHLTTALNVSAIFLQHASATKIHIGTKFEGFLDDRAS